MLVGRFQTPDKLLASLVTVSESDIVYPERLNFQTIADKISETVGEIKAIWAEIRVLLNSRYEQALDKGLFKKPLSTDYHTWWTSVDTFFLNFASEFPANLQWFTREGLEQVLNGSKFRKKEKKEEFFSAWPFDLYDSELFQTVDSLGEQLCCQFRIMLAEQLQGKVLQKLEQAKTCSYDSLIIRTAEGVTAVDSDRCREVIGNRYSVVLVDEFQDTDHYQWRIFSSLFAEGEHFLYLIGDPKQAIYKFRGADIYSYFQAKKRADHLLTIGNNYRSHTFLVEGVNSLFSQLHEPFLFPKKMLGYEPVNAARTSGEYFLSEAGRDVSGFVYGLLPETQKKLAYCEERFLHYCTEEARKLLSGEEIHIVEKNEQKRIQPADIAFLVRTHAQASKCRLALEDAGIPAVIASQKSVYASKEAEELVYLMSAFTNPENINKVKTAMSVSWFGLRGNELYEIWNDEGELEEWLALFHQYGRLLKEKGVLATVMHLLYEGGVIIDLAVLPESDRKITNITHLAEQLGQVEDENKFGAEQLLQWFGTVISGEEPQQDGMELRLEKDDQAIKIITLHGSKGLEYPIVFCPYFWHQAKKKRGRDRCVICHDTDGRQVVDFGSALQDEHEEMEAFEEKAEDLRLLYVGVTRASLRCYLMWGDIRASSTTPSCQTALGHLLFAGAAMEYEEQYAAIQTQCRVAKGVHLVILNEKDGEGSRIVASEDTDKDYICRKPGQRSLHTDRQMSSFSALSQLSEYQGGLEVGKSGGDGDVIAYHHLPAGPAFGNAVHDCLEHLSFSCIREGNPKDLLVETVRNTCSRYGVQVKAEELISLLKDVVSTPCTMPGTPGEKEEFCLADLDDNDVLKEMGFYLHVDRVTTAQINNLLEDEKGVAPLSYKAFKGYLTGFIDLLFRVNGRYYIIDYKTNHLGAGKELYSPERLENSMASHNYGLQYWIYSVVVHRYLKKVLSNYSYGHHFGGVMYLFVRAMDPQTPDSGVFFAKPEEKKICQLDALFGNEEKND